MFDYFKSDNKGIPYKIKGHTNRTDVSMTKDGMNSWYGKYEKKKPLKSIIVRLFGKGSSMRYTFLYLTPNTEGGTHVYIMSQIKSYHKKDGKTVTKYTTTVHYKKLHKNLNLPSKSNFYGYMPSNRRMMISFDGKKWNNFYYDKPYTGVDLTFGGIDVGQGGDPEYCTQPCGKLLDQGVMNIEDKFSLKDGVPKPKLLSRLSAAINMFYIILFIILIIIVVSIVFYIYKKKQNNIIVKK